jgi:hypothetical protein
MTTKPPQETPLVPGGRGLRQSGVIQPPVTDQQGAGTAKPPRESRFIELTRWILIPVLVVAGMLLPPFSLGGRLLQGEWTVIGEGRMPVWSVNDPDGAQVVVPEQPLDGKLRLRLSPVPRLHFLAGQVDEYLLPAVTALPFNLAVKSPFYEVQRRGVSPSDAVLTLPIPNDAEPYATLDLYAWDGNAWKWLPSTVIQADDVIVARLETLPEMTVFAAVQPLPPEPVVAADLSDLAVLPEDGAQVLNEVYSMGAILSDNGTLEVPAEPLAPGEGTWRELPVVRNWDDDGTVRSDLTNEVLGNQVLRQKHIAAIVAFARTEEHRGIVLDYRDVNPALRESFTSFVRDLAEQLHAGGRTLVVRVAWPTQISAVDWNTGTYDWRALGEAADVVLLTGPMDPHAYVEGGPVEQGIAWATRYIDRYKLQLVAGARGVNHSEEGVAPISYGAALAFLSRIAIDTAGESVSPGDEISLSLTNLSGSPGIQFDTGLQAYWFFYTDDQGSAHTVWLENETSLIHKLQLVARHRLRGVMVEHLAEPMSDPALWTAVRAYSHGELQPQETTFSVVWEVSSATGRRLAQATRSLDDAGVVWQAPETPGVYEYSAVIAANGQPVAEKGVAVVQVVAYTPTPTSTPTSTPTPTPTPTGTPTPTPTAAPTTAPRPAATPTPTSSPVASAASVVPTSGYGFGYGIQAHAIGQDVGPIFDHIHQLGFRWLKVQVEWKNHEGPKGQYAWADIDRLVEHAQLNGIKLLLSVVKAPTWSRPAGTDLGVEGPPANPQDYADFVGAMAARYRGRVHAYEIWNEQNLYYEWGREPLDASRYVKLLKLAYQAIKAQDPKAVVVSGALTPTGINDGVIAIDDRTYLQQMYNAGLKWTCDAIGVHPSGYANPPDSKFGEGPAGPSHNDHPSFFFRHTMEDYRTVMVINGDGNKRLWPTEFGWSSTHGLGAPPAAGYEYANYNTEQDQASYIVRAYQMSKAWGWVGPMFLWNLNFGPASGKFDEKAGFGIVYPNWAPRPAFYALANMPK